MQCPPKNRKAGGPPYGANATNEEETTTATSRHGRNIKLYRESCYEADDAGSRIRDSHIPACKLCDSLTNYRTSRKEFYTKMYERCQVNRARRVAGAETKSTSDVK